MAPIVLTIDNASPPGDVFAYATNPVHFAEWQRDVVSVQAAASTPGHPAQALGRPRRRSRGLRPAAPYSPQVAVAATNRPDSHRVRRLPPHAGL